MSQCAHKVRFGLFGLAILSIFLGLVLPLRAQEESCVQRTAFVSVEDGRGHPVIGLSAANFRATLGKSELRLVSAEPNPPRRILIVFDISTSMHRPFQDRASSLALVNLIQRSAPEVQFAFSTFSDHFEMKESLTADHGALIQKIVQDLKTSPRGGSSAVYDAAAAAVATFKSPQIGDAVLMVTDGDDNISFLSSTDAERRIAESQVRLFAIALQGADSAGNLRQVDQGNKGHFAEMVDGSGGEIFYLGTEYPSKAVHPKRPAFRIEKDYRNLADVADGILRYMATGYRLEALLPAQITKPQEWKLEIVDRPQTKGSELFVRYSPKLLPCSVTNTRK